MYHMGMTTTIEPCKTCGIASSHSGVHDWTLHILAANGNPSGFIADIMEAYDESNELRQSGIAHNALQEFRDKLMNYKLICQTCGTSLLRCKCKPKGERK